MTPFPIFLALKYLKPKRSVMSVVTVVSILGVTLGVAILVIVMSVMTGFDNMWRDKILSFRPHITVIGRYGPITDEEELCERIDRYPWVTASAPVIETLSLARNDDRFTAPFVIGVDPARSEAVSRIRTNILEGGSFSLEDTSALIGIDEAYRLNVNVGHKVLLYSEVNMQGLAKDEMYLPEEVEIEGVFRLGMQKFDSGFIMTSLEVARNLVGIEEGVGKIYIMTDDPYRFADYCSEIRKDLGAEYIVKSWSDIDKVLFDALKVEKTMMFILLAFITIVAIFCVTNTLIVITVQKTSEIGLLKALGFSPGKIMSAFVFHGWIQCLTGIALGSGLGVLVLHNMQNIVGFLARFNVSVFPKEIYGFDKIPYEIRTLDFLIIAITVMVFCTLSSSIPARRAAKLDPVEALRHE